MQSRAEVSFYYSSSPESSRAMFTQAWIAAWHAASEEKALKMQPTQDSELYGVCRKTCGVMRTVGVRISGFCPCHNFSKQSRAADISNEISCQQGYHQHQCQVFPTIKTRQNMMSHSMSSWHSEALGIRNQAL
jgi:hypothetical protein